MKVTAIVPAAGVSRRMKRGTRKPFLILGDKPILAHTLSRLQSSPHINEIILLVHKNDIRKAKNLITKFKLNKVKKIKNGGKTRFESVWNGLLSASNKTDLIFIHDGVRPFLSSSIISETINKATRFGGAVAAVPATSTIKFIKRQGIIDSTPDRTRLCIVGTPQVFKHRLILNAYKKGQKKQKKIFDDSMLVEHLGSKIKIVQDSYKNIKITTPLDLIIGEAILKHGDKI